MTTKYKLALIPEGYKVVPEEPTDEMLEAADLSNNFMERYGWAIKAAPQLTTPPVLRWEGKHLLLGGTIVSSMLGGYGEFFLAVMGNHVDVFNSEQEARRAAEKELGIPFEVEEV